MKQFVEVAQACLLIGPLFLVRFEALGGRRALIEPIELIAVHKA
jgi:hypothetical protein